MSVLIGRATATAKRVFGALETITGEPEVWRDPDLLLFELQLLDSLRTVELVVALSEAFGLELALSEIDRDLWATPARIVAFMEARVGP